MRERYDWMAIGPDGVVAICSDYGDAFTDEFVAHYQARGFHLERAPVEEACRRHLEFVMARWGKLAPASPSSPIPVEIVEEKTP